MHRFLNSTERSRTWSEKPNMFYGTAKVHARVSKYLLKTTRSKRGKMTVGCGPTKNLTPTFLRFRAARRQKQNRFHYSILGTTGRNGERFCSGVEMPAGKRNSIHNLGFLFIC